MNNLSDNGSKQKSPSKPPTPEPTEKGFRIPKPPKPVEPKKKQSTE